MIPSVSIPVSSGPLRIPHQVAHPFHIHKVQFQIVQYIDGSDTAGGKAPIVYEYPDLPAHMMGSQRCDDRQKKFSDDLPGAIR